MIKAKPKFQKYIFVCVNQREDGTICCGTPGREIRDALKNYIKNNGLASRLRVSQAGCLDVCNAGPNVLVYPENIWYQQVTLADVPRIIAEQIDPLLSSSPQSTVIPHLF